MRYTLLPVIALIGLLSAFSPPLPAGAAVTYYVDSVSGNDAWSGALAQPNGGQSDGPWRTIARANQVFDDVVTSPGDSLNLKRGSSWPGTTLKIFRSGSAASPVIVQSYGTGAAPVITSVDNCLNIEGSYVQVTGITTTACYTGSDPGYTGVRIAGDNNVLSAGVTTYNKMGIFITDGANYNRVTGYTIANNQRGHPTDTGSNGLGMNLHGSNNEIDHNTFQANYWVDAGGCRNGDAIEIYGDDNSSASDNNIHHNLAIDNKTFSELGHSQNNSTVSGNTYSFNVIRGSLPASYCPGSGATCSVGGQGDYRGLSALVTRGVGDGYGPVYNTKFLNNTIYLTGSCSQGIVCSNCATNILTVKNTISVAAWKGAYFGVALGDINYNILRRTGTESNPFHCQGPSGACPAQANGPAHGTDPQFSDASAWDLHPTGCASPPLDAGIMISGLSADFDSVPIPQDGDANGSAAPDIGAYEVTAASCDGDADGDGVLTADEAACGSNAFNANRRPERTDGIFDNVDDDGDTLVDEALPSGAGSYDCDGDGFSGVAETHVFGGAGGRDQDACGTDAWPLDISSDSPPDSFNRVNIRDVNSFIIPRRLNTSPGELNFGVRWDFIPGTTAPFAEHLNIMDIQSMTFNLPPMFGGQTKALNGPACPWAP